MSQAKWSRIFRRNKKSVPTRAAPNVDLDTLQKGTGDLWDVAYQDLQQTDRSLVSLHLELEVQAASKIIVQLIFGPLLGSRI